MPKRSNSFQRFIQDLEKLLAPEGATVEESGMVLDRSTGAMVEVDIVITITGHHKVVIGVECRNQRRPADTQWIDQLGSRKQYLELDKLVAVSRNGFTKNAEVKAKQFGIHLVKMKAKKVVRWISTFAFLQQIVVEENIEPTAINMGIRFLDEPSWRYLTKEEASSAELSNQDGKMLGSLLMFANGLIQLPQFKEILKKAKPVDGVIDVEADGTLVAGVKLEFGGESRLLAEYKVLYRAIQRIRTAPFEHLDYSDSQIVSAELDLFDQRKMKLLLAQAEGDEPKMSISWDKEEEEK